MIDNVKALKFVSLAAEVQFNIVGGAAGWIDTDVSATTGTNTRRLWIVCVNTDAPQPSGIRQHGSADTVYVWNKGNATMFTYVDAAGHVDLYRDAADGHYQFLGYLE